MVYSGLLGIWFCNVGFVTLSCVWEVRVGCYCFEGGWGCMFKVEIMVGKWDDLLG